MISHMDDQNSDLRQQKHWPKSLYCMVTQNKHSIYYSYIFVTML